MPGESDLPMGADVSSSSTSSSGLLPDFHVLCLEKKFSNAFNTAVNELYPGLRDNCAIHVHDTSLQHLSRDLHFDAVVSPANSYGRLDGAFDDALAREFGGPSGEYDWITRRAQQVLYDKWKGFAPPGTCTVVPMAHETGSGVNAWGTKYLLLCPTMRIPWVVKWDREVAYECIWSLLCVVDEHNKHATAEEDKIKSILMTPLATGVGLVSPRRWAEQCVLAMKYWVEAVENPQVWSNLQWAKILEDHEDVVETYRREM